MKAEVRHALIEWVRARREAMRDVNPETWRRLASAEAELSRLASEEEAKG